MATVTFLEPGTDATEDLVLFVNTATSSGTVASATDQAHVGPCSLKVTVTVQGGYAEAFRSNLFGGSGGALSFWVRFSDATPVVDTLFITTATNADNQASLGIGLDTTGVLRICGRNCTSQAGSTVLSANTWYRLAMSHQYTSSTDWDMKLYLNGVLEVSTGDADGSQTIAAIQGAEIGINNIGAGGFDGSGLWTDSADISIWFDSLYADDRSDLTDPGTTDGLDVTAKRPDSNGSFNDFTTQIGSGGSGYGSGHSPQVNERPLETANGWQSPGAGASDVEEYTIEDAATGDANLTGATRVAIRGWLYASSASAETGKIRVDNVDTNISLTSTQTLFQANSAFTSYPSGGRDIGIVTSTDAIVVRLYECGILIAYIPPTGGRRFILIPN